MTEAPSTRSERRRASARGRDIRDRRRPAPDAHRARGAVAFASQQAASSAAPRLASRAPVPTPPVE